ncbi:MAG TPA: hypothetical protein VLA14_05875 [Polyangia bacterium]|jgi:hypothetical protein|nr:hypothetical protein [Polyangia bacterium]
MHRERITLLLLSATLSMGFAVVGCTSSEPIYTGGAGSSGSSAGSSGSAGASGSAGTSGSAGATNSTAGTGGGTAGSAAGTSGSAGATSSTAGTGGGTAGASGSAGTSGTAGTSGSAGAGGTGGAGGAGGAQLSFATDIMPIINTNCHDCHQTGMDGMLDLTAANAFKSLVGLGSGGAVLQNKTCKVGGTTIMYRVAPGDPAHSLMYLKITTPQATLTTDNCGNTMPKGKTQLGTMTPADATTIQTWIMQGANP